jgi:photosystem II stability/assembly factor-like uncharacterized protein
MKFTVLFAGLATMVLFGAGCAGTTTTTGPDGGVYRTANQGAVWAHPDALNLGQKIGSIANVGTASVAFDPQDPLVLYVGTTQNGLLQSMDDGDSWQQMSGLSTGLVGAVAVDPRSKCTIYAARANQILKTDSCGRDWNQMYYDPRIAQVFTAIAIDPLNSRQIYAGNTDGDLFRSVDGGVSWQAFYREDGVRINEITIDPRNTRTMYVATNGSGILKTTDGGATWQRIREVLDQYDGARRPLHVVLDPTAAGVLYNISRYTILRSEDAGQSWRALTLPTPPNGTNVKAFAIHPRNAQQLVYATDTSIVFTNDLGKTWAAKKLPTTRAISFLRYDQGPQNNLFLGTVPR